MLDNEDQSIATVVQSLVDAFPDLPGSQVRACVQSVHATFDDAKVRTYIPILVAREARAFLVAAAGEFSSAVGDGDGRHGGQIGV